MNPNDSNDPSDREEPSERTEPGLWEGLTRIANLLRKLEEAGERHGTGHFSSGNTSVDYDVTIGSGIGDRRPRPNRREGRWNRDSPDRTTARERHAHDEYYVTSRKSDGEVVVFADLPGVDVDELTVGLEGDGETLLIAVGGTTVERLSLPWAAEAERSSFNNGVLEVHLRENS